MNTTANSHDRVRASAKLRALATGIMVSFLLTTRAKAASLPESTSTTKLTSVGATAGVTPAYMTFGELSLEAAQAAGVAASPDVAAAKAKLEQAEAALRLARGTAYPTFTAGYAQQPQGNPPGPSLASRLTTAGLQITLSDLTSAASTKRAAAFSLAAAEADQKSAETVERAKVARLYFDALIATSTAIARDEALSLTQAQADAAQKRFAAGDAPRLDAVRAQVAVRSAEADLATAQADGANAVDALRVEAGLPANSSLTLSATSSPLSIGADSSASAPTPEAAVVLARRRRPELASADLLRRAAAANVQAARAGAIPTITLSAGYGSGTDSGVLIRGPVANIQMLIPLAPIGHAKTATAEGLEAEAIAKSASTARTVLTEIAATTRSLRAAYVAEHSARAALDLAAQDLNGAQIGFRNGATTPLDFTIARNTYIQSKIAALAAIYNLRKLQALFNIGVGN